MTKYYYAVKEGRQIGIYDSWAECEAQVKGYSNAVYKKFSNYTEALGFIGGNAEYMKEESIIQVNANEMIAYVDGSFHEQSGYYSYGAVIFTTEGKETFIKKDNDKRFVDMRNVAGEIMGAMFSMEEALKREKKILHIYYDYTGIEKWAIGKWKTNRYGTREYRKYYLSIKDKLRVEFNKVKSHSGDKYNEEADQLAKKALGI